MHRKLSIPCCFCKQRKGCRETFLCSKAFAVRLGLSLVAAVVLVVVMNQVFPQLLSQIAPDSYSVRGHPMDEIREQEARESAQRATGTPADTPVGAALAQDP